MQLPIVGPAPLVREHSQAFRQFFCDKRQFSHFQNYLTGLIVLENKSLSNISRCILDGAHKSNLSRFFSQAPWSDVQINEARNKYMLAQTESHRLSADESNLIIDDSLCEHVGSLFEYIEHHYNHCHRTYPLAHNIVTSHYLSGAVRYPVDLELYRRYEEVTQWEKFVAIHFPDQKLPRSTQERKRLHKTLDPQLLEVPEFRELHQQFLSKIELGKILIDRAIEQELPFQSVLFDSWYLCGEMVEYLKSKGKDWTSLLKVNRNLEAYSIRLRDEKGQRIQFQKPRIQVRKLVELIPRTAFRAIELRGQSYWCFSLCCRIPEIGKVRLVISFEDEELTGRYGVLVTNRSDWTAKKTLEKYLQRWPIETFYWDGKQNLGLDEYRMRTFEAIQAHWCLVFVAYSILHLACLPPSPPKGQTKRSAVPRKTIGQVCRQQGQVMVEQLILFAHDQLQKGLEATEVFNKLFERQNKEVLA